MDKGFLIDVQPLVAINRYGATVTLNAWNLRLSIRQVAGQQLTYRMVTSAIKALGPLNLYKPQRDLTTPANDNKLFTFEIHEAPYGLVAQGVVTECDPADKYGCFKPHDSRDCSLRPLIEYLESISKDYLNK